MRFDAVTLDLDGTLLPDTTAFEAVLRDLGEGEFVAASDARFFAGDITLEACFWEQWARVRQHSPQRLSRAMASAPWLPGIADAVGALRAAGVQRVALLTDQPDLLADYAARWGLDAAIASPVTTADGTITDIDARFDKWANLAARLEAWDIAPERVCHVGNGDNDVPVWQHVGAGVAAFAAPAVAAAATIDVGRPNDMASIVAAIQGL